MQSEILIIDDDKVICLLHSHVVRLSHFKDAKIFTNPKKALEDIRTKKEVNKYLIFLDINMPELDGWQFLNELNKLEEADRFVVILVTSSVDMADKTRAESYSIVQGYIEKPLTLDRVNSLQLNGNFQYFSN